MSIIRSALGLLVLSQILLVNGCGRENKEANIFFQDTLYMPSYASGFIIKSFGESSVLEIKNPWQGAADVGMQLFLSHNGEKAPDNFKGTVAEVPLKRVVCMSSSYVAFIDAIDETDVIKAVSGARYITNDTIRARFARGELRDVGYDSNLNYELIAGLRPDMVFIYGIAGEDRSVTEKFDEMSIPYIYIGDYVEQSPLGKAEWLVAFGEMFGRRDQALSTFVSIENNYLETCEIACDYVGTNKESFSGLPAKPLVMLNAPYRDTWFVPGDRSYIVKLINDAGGEYACVGDDSERSRPISAESAFLYASKADVWLNPGQASSMIELKELNPQFADIRAVKKGRVFNCNARTTAEGGSDFWESGAVRPDIVLKDLVKILHPELMRGYQLYYFKEIKLIRGLDVP